MSEVLSSLASVTGIEYKGGAAQDYYRKLVQKIASLSDDEWNELSEEAKEWYNACASAYDADGDDAVFPEIDGFEETEAAPEEAAPEEAKAGKKAGKKAAPKAPKEPKEKKVREVSPSNSGTMRELFLENVDISLDDLLKQLEEKGMVAKKSSAHIVWFGSKKIIEMLIGQGYFKNAKGEVFKVVKQ